MTLLEVRNLKVYFPVRPGVFGRTRGWVRAVDGVSFSLGPGETLGLVGESGCGKSTVARAVVGLVRPTEGEVCFEEAPLTRLRGRRLRLRRRKFQMIFQDPAGSLDPRLTIGQSVGEALAIHRIEPTRAGREARVKSLLEAVGLHEGMRGRYPHEFSGGQRQRIGIARALAVEPRLLVCDEPVSALDVSVQAQIVNLLCDLQQARGMALLFIAHDLAVVEHVSRRILVMYLGRTVEMGDASSVVREPVHPYTQALISSVPVTDPSSGRKRIVLGGEVPSPVNPPPGCPFHPRCPVAEERCRRERPAWREVKRGHWAACHLAEGQTP